MEHRVTVYQDEDGVFIAEVPTLSGCISQGATRAEAVENIKEAIELYLESIGAHGAPSPPPIRKKSVTVQEIVRTLSKLKFEIDCQKDSHIVLRQTEYPFRRIVVPDCQEMAQGTLRSIVKQAGLTTVEELKNLL